MALLDIHILAALKAGFPDYLDSQAAFDELFPGVAKSTLAHWRSELRTSTKEREPITFREGLAPNSPEGARLICVTLMGEQPTESYIGESTGRLYDGRDTVGHVDQERVEILIMSTRSDLTRSMHVITKAVLLRAQVGFMQAGYRALVYEGAAPLELDERLAAEDNGLYVRILTYAAESEFRVPLSAPGSASGDKPFFVQYSGVEEDPARDPAQGAGTPGGVTPAVIT